MSAKILPVLSVFIAYVPAIVFVGITGLVPRDLVSEPDVLPSYSDYYGYVTAAIVVFTAFVAPELLCGDRRDRMLGLYLASPLTREQLSALQGRRGDDRARPRDTWATALPPPGAHRSPARDPPVPAAVFELLWKMVLAGIVIAALQAALSLAAASFTTRRAAASAAIILILVGSAAVSETLLDTRQHG